jgi:hypothetical protein
MSGIGFRRDRFSLRRDKRDGLSDPGDWRQAIWNRWLISYLTPKAPSDEEADESGASSQAGVESDKPEVAAPSQSDLRTVPAPPAASSDTEGLSSPGAEPPPELRVDSSFSGRNGARARLDALLERVDSLEGTLDSLVQRLQRTSSQDRLEVRRITDALDRVGELQERHTDALLSCTRALERLERRMMGLERHALARVESGAPLGTFHSDPPRAPEPELRETVTPSGRFRPPLSGARLVDSAQAFQGNLSDLSVSTLLSMFELEQRTGTLDIETQEHALSVELEAGKLTSVHQGDGLVDAVNALASVIDCRNGRFTFSPGKASGASDAALSVGSVLLRISQKNDEEKRVLYST